VKWWPFRKRPAGAGPPKAPGFRLPRIRLPDRDQLLTSLRETCLVAGFFAVARGLWIIYPPATWIVCGALLIYVGLPKGRDPKPPERR
jgi:hypothetical protein